jgi:hypothetical protein
VTSTFIKTMKNLTSEINGHLDILIHQKEDEFDNVKECWNEILIHGDPEG